MEKNGREWTEIEERRKWEERRNGGGVRDAYVKKGDKQARKGERK